MTYQPRSTRCVRLSDINGWRMKVYTITTGPAIDAELLDSAEVIAGEVVGPVSDPGVGFVIVHHGEDAIWLLVDTWHGDIVHHKLFSAPLSGPSGPVEFAAVASGGPTACVYELEVYQHESRSLIRHVLGADVDIERYANDWLTIHVDGEASPSTLPAPEVTIRPLERSDESRWRELWEGYQGYYRLELGEEITAATWERIFDDSEPIYGLGAVDVDGELVGFTHYVPHRSTMSLSNRCYLHDLYADPNVRSLGIGRALVEAVYAAAEADGHGAVYWLTEHFNGRARRLYDRVGVLTPFVRYNQPT